MVLPKVLAVAFRHSFKTNRLGKFFFGAGEKVMAIGYYRKR
jgi:hypothetical protein